MLLFFGQIHPGDKNGSKRGPSLKNFLFKPKGFTKQTEYIWSIDLKACGKKCCYFWFHSEVKYLRRFDVFLDLVILAYFNAII